MVAPFKGINANFHDLVIIVKNGPQPMDPLVLYVFSIECSDVILWVSLNKR